MTELETIERATLREPDRDGPPIAGLDPSSAALDGFDVGAPDVVEGQDGHGNSDTDPGDGPAVEGPVIVVGDSASRAAPPTREESTDGQPLGPPPPMPTMIGRYQVRRLLGEGGFGRVYLAWDGALNRDVAVKVPRAGAFVSPKHAEAFVREASLAAGLKHHAIVTVHDIGRDADDSLYLVLEYVEGQTLSDLLRAETVTHRRLAELLALVAEALHYAHSRGLVHRDLKPANLLVDRQGRPHVTDFGLAVHGEGVRSLGRQIAGTLHYMAPEQVLGESRRLDGRTDVWSLGVVLYQMLTGRLPFEGADRPQVFSDIVHRDPRPPRQVDPALPHELDRICLKCLSKRRDDRYQNAMDLASDLWQWVTRGGKAEDSAPGAPSPGQGKRLVASSASTAYTESAALRPKAIPKGLRSFDASDEAFFLALLPGPYDRDGLPECLRFWKSRVESADPDEAFPVGLLYGPSGSGKSSLIKAGLFPRLAPWVRPVYVEATPDGTESRLLRGLRKACPALPEGPYSLADVIRILRETPALRRGKKLILVIDQFELWLHGRRSNREGGLVEGLRQCDGVSVQCMVMTRGDFGAATLWFMDALEVRWVEAENCALVDCFDPAHAADVLVLFGRALGRLPEEAPLTTDQQRFIDQAVADMISGGRVNPVRLATFVETFRGKGWNPESLSKAGGAEGVGATFLEESLGPAASNPRRLAHRESARSLLRSLLPAPGVNVKGHMMSYAELLTSSRYADRPEAFDDLIRLLGSELRLIAPCDPDKDDLDGDPRPATGRSFRLTDESLVPSLRKWLTLDPPETVQGRTRLLLESLAVVWVARPVRKYLPSILECIWILIIVDRSSWSPSQARMMKAAARHYVGMLVVVGSVVAALAGMGLRVVFWWEG